MKRSCRGLALVLVIGLIGGEVLAFPRGRVPRGTQDAAREAWVGGYLKLEEATRYEQEKQYTLALEKYEEALAVFEAVAREFPHWNPSLIDFRTTFCHERITRLKVALALAANEQPREELIVRVEKLSEEAESARNQLSAVLGQLETARTKLELSEQEKATLVGGARERAELREANERLTATVTELKAKLRQVEAEKDAQAREADRNARAARRYEAAAAARDEAQARLAESQKAAAKLDASLAAVTREGDARTRELAAARAQVAAGEREVAQLSTVMSGKDEQISELKRELATATGNASELWRDLSALRETQRREREAHESALLAASQQRGQLAGQATELTSKLEERSRELSAKSAAYEQLKATLAELDKEHSTASGELQQRVMALQTRADELAAALSQTKAELAVQVRENEQKSAALAAAQDQLRVLGERQATAVAGLKQELATLADRNKALSEEVAAGAVALAAAKQSLQAEQARTQELERLVALAKGKDVAKLEEDLAARAAELAAAKATIQNVRQELLAKEEAASRLAEEKKKALAEEKARLQQEREREEHLHAMLTEAAALERGGDKEKALWQYQEVLKAEPKNGEVLKQTGLLLADLGRDEEAERYLSQAFELNPNDTKLMLRLGFVQIRQEKIHLAIGTLARAVALEPSNADAHRLLGLACHSVGWSSAAESLFRESFKLNSKNAETAYNLAILLATLDTPRMAEAEKWYQTAKSLGAKPDPNLEEFFKSLGE